MQQNLSHVPNAYAQYAPMHYPSLSSVQNLDPSVFTGSNVMTAAFQQRFEQLKSSAESKTSQDTTSLDPVASGMMVKSNPAQMAYAAPVYAVPPLVDAHSASGFPIKNGTIDVEHAHYSAQQLAQSFIRTLQVRKLESQAAQDAMKDLQEENERLAEENRVLADKVLLLEKQQKVSLKTCKTQTTRIQELEAEATAMRAAIRIKSTIVSEFQAAHKRLVDYIEGLNKSKDSWKTSLQNMKFPDPDSVQAAGGVDDDDEEVPEVYASASNVVNA